MKEEIEEIENTLKVSKPYNELGTYNYFNCESIENLLEENKSLQSQLKAKEEENEHLKLVLSQIQYCPYDDKCGELYDCSKEEYETMTQSNMKLSLKNQQLEEVIKEAREYIETNTCWDLRTSKMLEILSKGENK